MSANVRSTLIGLIRQSGYPEVFGELIADELKTEKQMNRMIGYLLNAKPSSMEEIADEMLAIREEFAGYQRKHIAESANRSRNRLLNRGLK
ncbi:MAG: hypothetical protein ACI32N_10560 [Bulleidia sp.]